MLDALIKVREEVDGTLSLRCSCRSSICGSCAMRINGHAGLACKTQASDAVGPDGVIVVEPPGVMPVIKDLVVDFKPFWDKISEVEPYLQPQGEEPEGEYLASNESMLHLSGVTSCIMCGACVSDCTVLEVDPTFLGPAALAKAYRFTADPRDGDAEGVSKERLEKLSEVTGMWDCTRCSECVQVCPKGVAPMDRIMALRDQAMEAGLTDNNGSRHASAFTESVAHSGWLDELQLTVKVCRERGTFWRCWGLRRWACGPWPGARCRPSSTRASRTWTACASWPGNWKTRSRSEPVAFDDAENRQPNER